MPLPILQENGRCAASLVAKHGHEISEDLLGKFAPQPLVDLSTMTGGSFFKRTCWLQGFSPTMKWVGVQSFGAATVRALRLGEVAVLTMPLDGVMKFFQQKRAASDAATMGMTQLLNHVSQMGAQDMADLNEGGCKVYHHVQKANELVFIPMSWIMVEWSVAGTALVAARKNVMVDSSQSRQNFTAFKSLMDRDRKGSEKVDLILGLFKSPAMVEESEGDHGKKAEAGGADPRAAAEKAKKDEEAAQAEAAVAPAAEKAKKDEEAAQAAAAAEKAQKDEEAAQAEKAAAAEKTAAAEKAKKDNMEEEKDEKKLEDAAAAPSEAEEEDPPEGEEAEGDSDNAEKPATGGEEAEGEAEKAKKRRKRSETIE